MRLSAVFSSYINLGSRASYRPWETFLTRRLNYLSAIGFFNVLVALAFFAIIGEYELIGEMVAVLIAAPFVVLLNVKKNYIWSAYLFFLIGVALFFFVTLKMGYESYCILFYFPILISLVQLLGRRETIRHMVILMGIFFVSLVAVVWLATVDFLNMHLTEETLRIVRPFCILLSFFSAIALIAIVTLENIRQEKRINRMLSEKEVLVAEVFHRVKNNLNIVTSLINLRKNASDSPEVHEALDDCRNRVFSMALVHQKIYSTPNVALLNFSDYVRDLANELINALGGSEAVRCRIDASPVELHLGDAIPCGLIVNELVTNSFKYATPPEGKLAIGLRLWRENERVCLEVRDNGECFDLKLLDNEHSLGMELIRSLCEQLDASYQYAYEDGCLFRMSFRQTRMNG